MRPNFIPGTGPWIPGGTRPAQLLRLQVPVLSGLVEDAGCRRWAQALRLASRRVFLAADAVACPSSSRFASHASRETRRAQTAPPILKVGNSPSATQWRTCRSVTPRNPAIARAPRSSRPAFSMVSFMRASGSCGPMRDLPVFPIARSGRRNNSLSVDEVGFSLASKSEGLGNPTETPCKSMTRLLPKPFRNPLKLLGTACFPRERQRFQTPRQIVSSLATHLLQVFSKPNGAETTDGAERHDRPPHGLGNVAELVGLRPPLRDMHQRGGWKGESLTRLPSLRAITRKPSNLISCNQISPEGGCGALIGRHGGRSRAAGHANTETAWRTVRHGIAGVESPGTELFSPRYAL